jgi:hypothetical protein
MRNMAYMATPQRKRPHPAKRARAITGAISMASVLGLTGYLASAAHTTAAVTTSGTTPTTVTTVASSSDSGLAAATASTPSSSATTSSHTS